MKTLSFEQMANVNGGTLKKTLTCISQISGGISTLVTVAAIGIFVIGPVGWLAFGFGAISLIGGVAADPTACD
jgi:hypothetical protein